MTRLERDVEELALTLEGPDLPQETYLEAVGRITNAWMTAGEMLAAQTVPPETDESEPPETDTEWVPMVQDPRYLWVPGTRPTTVTAGFDTHHGST